MAIVQADIDLMNMAIGRLGAKQITLASYNAGTRPEDVQAELHYEHTRDSLLRSFEWPFAKTRFRLVSSWLTLYTYTTDHYVWNSSTLYKCSTAHVAAALFATDAANWTEVTTATEDTVFNYNYSLPANCLRLVEVIDDDNLDWNLETNYINTNSTAIDIVYIDKVTTTTEWSLAFKEMLVCRLALNLLGPLTGIGKPSLKMRQLLLQELQVLQKQVRAIARQEGNNSGNSDWNNARLI